MILKNPWLILKESSSHMIWLEKILAKNSKSIKLILESLEDSHDIIMTEKCKEGIYNDVLKMRGIEFGRVLMLGNDRYMNKNN